MRKSYFCFDLAEEAEGNELVKSKENERNTNMIIKLTDPCSFGNDEALKVKNSQPNIVLPPFGSNEGLSEKPADNLGANNIRLNVLGENGSTTADFSEDVGTKTPIESLNPVDKDGFSDISDDVPNNEDPDLLANEVSNNDNNSLNEENLNTETPDMADKLDLLPQAKSADQIVNSNPTGFDSSAIGSNTAVGLTPPIEVQSKSTEDDDFDLIGNDATKGVHLPSIATSVPTTASICHTSSYGESFYLYSLFCYFLLI